MEPRLWLERFTPQAGLEPGTVDQLCNRRTIFANKERYTNVKPWKKTIYPKYENCKLSSFKVRWE